MDRIYNSSSMKYLMVSIFFHPKYTIPQFQKQYETLSRNDRFATFALADVERVKPASTNAFRSYGKTSSQNAFFSKKFTPWDCLGSVSSYFIKSYLPMRVRVICIFESIPVDLFLVIMLIYYKN